MELAGWFCLCCNASFTTLQFHIWFHSTSVANFPPPSTIQICKHIWTTFHWFGPPYKIFYSIQGCSTRNYLYTHTHTHLHTRTRMRRYDTFILNIKVNTNVSTHITWIAADPLPNWSIHGKPLSHLRRNIWLLSRHYCWSIYRYRSHYKSKNYSYY